MGFSVQEYWNGLPYPSPGDLPDPGIEPMSLMSPTLVGGFFTTSTITGASLVAQGKESTCNPGEAGLIPGLGKSPKEGKGYPLQHFCLENPMDRGA